LRQAGKGGFVAKLLRTTMYTTSHGEGDGGMSEYEMLRLALITVQIVLQIVAIYFGTKK
jgi:hypothetical protein